MKQITLLLSLVLCSVGSLLAQRTITGTVTDDKGQPIVGATVVVKESSPLIGVSSDMDGKYSIGVPAGKDILVFSYMGFDSKELTIGASNMVDAQLVEGVELEGVVVTALGISREQKSLGYATTTIGGEDAARSGESNVISALSGKSSGIQVISSAGVPGASSKILIRGNSSINLDNQPLMVIDGMPYDNQTVGAVAGDNPFNANLSGVNNSNRALDINPEDIESVSVLKGPTASALYGTRAANGVLVITTKKGRKNQKLSVQISSNVEFSMVNKLPELQNQYTQGSGGGNLNAAGTASIAEGAFSPFATSRSWGARIGTNAAYDKSYDNMGRFFRTGTSFNNNISLSGGNENTSFRASFGNNTIEGIIPNTKFTRNTLRLNAETGNDKLRFQTSIGYTNSTDLKAQNGSNLSGVMLSLTRMPANFNLVGGDGPNGWDTPDGLSHTYLANYDNPFWTSYRNPNTSNVNRLTANGTLTYKATKWLEFLGRVGTDTYDDVRKQILEIGANDSETGLGEISDYNLRHTEVNSDILTTFSHKLLNDELDLRLMVGTSINSRTDKETYTRGRNFSVPGLYSFANTSQLYGSGETTEKKSGAVYTDLNIGYKGWIYFNGALRNDWISSIGPKTRGKGFLSYSASMSFVFSEFIKQNDILSFGKVRLGISKAGREPVPYSAATLYSAPFLTDGSTNGFSFPFNGSLNGFLPSTTYGNTNIEQEVINGLEFGTNLKFWNNRINFDFSYYDQLSSNLVIGRPIAPSSGGENLNVNIGKMRNKGIEIELSVDVVNKKNIKWTIGGNFSRNINEVEQLAPGTDEVDIEPAFTEMGSYAIVGKPFGAIYGTRWARTNSGKLIIGADGLPLLDDKRGFVGNPFPDFTAGIRSTLSAYGFTLNMLLDIRQGGDIWNGTIARLHRLGRTQESAANREQVFVVEGVMEDSTTANTTAISSERYYNYVVGDNGGASENAIFKGSWIRMREVTLSYDFPKIKQLKFLQNASVFITARNLFLITKYPGVDPETSLTGAGSNVSGFDYFNMPNTKSYLVGLKFGF